MNTPSKSSGTPVDEVIAPLPRISIQAFCETSEIASVVDTAAGDRRMDKAHVKVQMGGVWAAVEAYKNAPTPNVIVIETLHGRGELLEGLDKLAEACDPGTRVVVVGHVNDVLLYRDLMRRGVSEYVIAPISPIGFVKALSELFASPGAAPVGRTIAFVGAKGGAGASSVAHNVAWAISKSLGQNTAIVDLDLPFGTAGLDFNQDPTQGVADIVFAPDRADAAVVDRLLARCTEQLSLLAAPATLDRTYDVDDSAFDNAIDILRAQVPYVVLDVPHGWSGWTRRVLNSADEVVIVSPPDLASLRNTKNLFDLLRAARINDTPPRLILNGVGLPKRPEIKPADFCKAIESEAIAQIPFDAQLFGTASNNGQMIAEVQAGAKIAQIFVDVAQVVAGRAEIKRARKGLLEPLLSKLQRKKAS
ncbi:MAG: CpaE family protein [Labrys sp. (in: a-proteobacteria)]